MATAFPADNYPQSYDLNRSRENLMRYIYLTFRTCDRLSRDCVKHILANFLHTSWDTFVEEPNFKKKFEYDFVKYLGKPKPTLDECDTTILQNIFRYQAKLYADSVDVKIIKEIRESMEQLRTFRNSVAHVTSNAQLTDHEYENQMNKFMNTINNYNDQIFVSLRDCMKFLKQNKFETLAHFCQNNRGEVTLILGTLDENMLLIAKEVQPLMQMMKDLETRLVDTEARLQGQLIDTEERLEGQLIDTEERIQGRLIDDEARLDRLEHLVGEEQSIILPSSYLIAVPKLAGRDQDLKEVADCFGGSQLVSICGPPGVGKTSLALAYANEQRRRELESQSERCVYLFVRMLDLGIKKGMSAESIEQEIARTVGQLFPAISMILSETDNPIIVLLNHIREVLKHKHLFLILDNIDTVLNSQEDNVMGKVIENLISLGRNFQILLTSRDKSLEVDFAQLEIIDLQPISNTDCREWINAWNSRANLNENIIDSISNTCGGIQLILKLMISAARSRNPFPVDEISDMKRRKRFSEQLTKNLNWSFQLLTDDQLNFMKCASVFSSNFEKPTLFDFFQKLCDSDEDFDEMLDSCSDLSLLEYDKSACRYYLHPYIQDHIRDTVIADYPESEKLHAQFVLTYFQKLVSVGKAQLNKDAFETVSNEVVQDHRNYTKFMNTISGKKEVQVQSFHEILEEDDNEFYSCWMLTFFEYLDKFSRFKKELLSAVTELETIFAKLNRHSYLIICKCFLVHIYRLLTGVENLEKAAVKIDEAHNLSHFLRGQMMEPFCLGIINFTMGRFVQQTRTGSIKKFWKKEYYWENIPAGKHFSTAIEWYEQWKFLSSLDDIEHFKTARLIMTSRVQLFWYREKLDQARSEAVKDIHFAEIDIIVNYLSRVLGNHDEVAFAKKKQADHLKHYGRKHEADRKYANVYQLYKSWPEFRAQQIVVLKEWSDCDDNRQTALKKLQIAKQLLMKYGMENHAWAKTIQSRIDKPYVALQRDTNHD